MSSSNPHFSPQDTRDLGLPPFFFANMIKGGATHPSTPSQPAPSSRPRTSTTSATSATATPPSRTARPTPPRVNYPANRIWKAPPWTKNYAEKRTSTGRSGMRPRRMAWGVGVDVTRMFLRWRGRRGVVFLSGLGSWGGLLRRLGGRV